MYAKIYWHSKQKVICLYAQLAIRFIFDGVLLEFGETNKCDFMLCNVVGGMDSNSAATGYGLYTIEWQPHVLPVLRREIPS